MTATNNKYVARNLQTAGKKARVFARGLCELRGSLVLSHFIKTRDWNEGVQWVADLHPYGWVIVWKEDTAGQEDSSSSGSNGVRVDCCYVTYYVESLRQNVTFGVQMRYLSKV